jgi:hypothetical protein
MLDLQLQQPPSVLQLVDTIFDTSKPQRLVHLRNLTFKGIGIHGPLQDNANTMSLGLAVFTALELLDLSDNPDITGGLPDLLAGDQR